MSEYENTNTYETNKENTNFNEPPKKKKGFWWKVVALALCCSIIGGVVGAGVTMFRYRFIPNINISGAIDDDFFEFRRGFNYRFPFGFSFGNLDEFGERIEKGKNNKPFIGVSVTDSDDPEGACVKEVEKNSPAEKSGIQSGDIITAVNGIAVSNVDKLINIVEVCEDGEELTLTISRDGNTQDILVIVSDNSDAMKF